MPVPAGSLTENRPSPTAATGGGTGVCPVAVPAASDHRAAAASTPADLIANRSTRLVGLARLLGPGAAELDGGGERLVGLLNRQQYSCPRVYQTGRRGGEREGTGSDRVRRLGDDHDVVLSERVMHRFELPADALERLADGVAAPGRLVLVQTFQPLGGV